MPVNMDPKRKRRPEGTPATENNAAEGQSKRPTEADPSGSTEADLAEKEWKNLWEATEVIDMDTW